MATLIPLLTHIIKSALDGRRPAAAARPSASVYDYYNHDLYGPQHPPYGGPWQTLPPQGASVTSIGAHTSRREAKQALREAKHELKHASREAKHERKHEFREMKHELREQRHAFRHGLRGGFGPCGRGAFGRGRGGLGRGRGGFAQPMTIPQRQGNNAYVQNDGYYRDGPSSYPPRDQYGWGAGAAQQGPGQEYPSQNVGPVARGVEDDAGGRMANSPSLFGAERAGEPRGGSKDDARGKSRGSDDEDGDEDEAPPAYNDAWLQERNSRMR